MMQKRVFILSVCFLSLLCSMVMSNAESAVEYVPNEIIIKFKPAVEQDMSMSIMNNSVQQPSLALLMTKHKIMNASPLFRKRAGKTTSQGRELYRDMINKSRTEKDLPAIENVTDLSNIFVLQVEDGTDILAAVSEFSADPNVEYAEPNYKIPLADLYPPQDEEYEWMWGLHNTGENVINGENEVEDADIDYPEALKFIDDSGVVLQNVIVAVLDTGVDWDHKDLAANMWSNAGDDCFGSDDDGNGYKNDCRGWDWVDNDNNPDDGSDHGTHIAGTIAAVHNNIGVTGISPTTQIMALRTCNGTTTTKGTCDSTDLLDAMLYAVDKGAQVVNASFSTPYYSSTIESVVIAAYKSGIVFVAAAGNGERETVNDPYYGVNLDDKPYYPAAFTDDSVYNYTNVLSVAATSFWDLFTQWSNYGSNTVDLAAPGNEILSTVPNDLYDYQLGTSMATPHVAGVAALLLAQYPSMEAFEVVDRIKNSVDVKDALSGKLVSNGRLNAYNALADICPNEPVIIVNGTSYPTLQKAYDNVATVNGDIIQIQAVQLVEDINLAIIKTITIQGGYDCNFTDIIGYTRINGNGTIADGTITLKDIVIEK